MIYLLIGKQGSGKSHLAQHLIKNGLSGTKSMEPDDIAAADFIITDPSNISEVANKVPLKTFCIIKIDTDDDMRKIYTLRGTSPNERTNAEKLFTEKDKIQKESFDIFNDAIEAFRQNMNTFPENITNCIEYPNDYDEKTAEKFAKLITNHSVSNKKLEGIVKDAISLNIFNTNENNPDLIRLDTPESSEKFVSPDVVAGMLMSNPQEFWSFMLQYITLSKRFSDI